MQALVNTRDIEGGTDELGAAGDLTRWLRRHELIGRGARADARDVAVATALREALRALLIANAQGSRPREAWQVLDGVADGARLRLRFDAGTRRARLEPQRRDVAGALGVLVTIVAAATADGSWERLKACRRDGCRWAFYDHSQARAGVWCSMSICGNRTKVRRHRHRAAARPARRRTA